MAVNDFIVTIVTFWSGCRFGVPVGGCGRAPVPFGISWQVFIGISWQVFIAIRPVRACAPASVRARACAGVRARGRAGVRARERAGVRAPRATVSGDHRARKAP